MPGHPEVHVIGDLAASLGPNGEALPQLAQGEASTLFVVPSDVAAALGALATAGASFKQGGALTGGTPPTP